MKKLSTVIIALILAALIATLLPLQVFADSTDEKYISEVKIGVGKTASEAEKALEGYEILKDDSGNLVDLNKDAGGGAASKGNRVVYLGFMRTASEKLAVTDLAVMNMKGGYSVEDYEVLMESQMKEQIIPFVEGFLSAIEEYRENYRSSVAANKQRADYIHDALNKYTDDDCGGASLGDLLLNETKYEMGDAAYDALPDAEKKQHADILTMIAQSNGKVTLMIENLLTRAADTNETSWIERFTEKSYDDLVDETGLSPSKAKKQLAKLYDDDAMRILDKWDSFREELGSYDEAVAVITNSGKDDNDALIKSIRELDENSSRQERQRVAEGYLACQADYTVVFDSAQTVAAYEYLEKTAYDDGSLLDFFELPVEEIESDITMLYPLVAALSNGQRAGLDFVSLRELVMIAAAKSDGYHAESLDDVTETSIYDGVDRGIYAKGGVALTSDALRANALKEFADDNLLSSATIAMMVLSGVTLAATVAASTAYAIYAKQLHTEIGELKKVCNSFNESLPEGSNPVTYKDLIAEDIISMQRGEQAAYPDYFVKDASTYLSKQLSIGFGIVMIVFVSITTYLTYRDMVNHYKVDFTPIPRYMIDEKDLIGYNARGEKIVLKNQSAYYKAVTTNRSEGDEYFDVIGNSADLNGAVGKQWLALYAAKNEAEAPILADSLKAVAGSTEIPADYTTGIHAFGSDAAENLNNTLYVWNSSAKSVYVYFKTETSDSSTTGANFTGGTLALSAGGGLVLGAMLTAVGMSVSKKRKENKAVTA